MSEPIIIEGLLHSPFFIFIRDTTLGTGRELLDSLGLSDYRESEAEAVRGGDPHLATATAGTWILIADDWRYTLWHSKAFRRKVRAAAKLREIFAIMIGDSDYSFEIEHYDCGKIVRRYFYHEVWEPGKGTIRTNRGRPHPFESRIIHGQDPWPTLWQIAESIGIEAPRELSRYRFFVLPKKAISG